MSGTLKIVINSLQTPTNSKLTMVQLRAKAMQQLGMEPALNSTPEPTESGAVLKDVKTHTLK